MNHLERNQVPIYPSSSYRCMTAADIGKFAAKFLTTISIAV